MRRASSAATAQSARSLAGGSSETGSRRSWPPTAIARPARRASMTHGRSRSPSSARAPAPSSTARLSKCLRRDGLHFAQRSKAPERVELDLAHALAGGPEPPPDLLERLRLGVVEPVAKLEHAPFPIRERRERGGQSLAAQRDLDLVLGERPVAGDEVPEDRVLLVADRLVEARRGPRGGEHLVRLRERQARLLGDLLERRLPPQLRPEQPLGAVHLLEPLDDVNGHPDRPRLVRERTRDRLPDPPGRIGRELVAAAPVELLDRADEAQRPFLDQVEEGQALVAVVLRDRD